jgi:hypothetical protein
MFKYEQTDTHSRVHLENLNSETFGIVSDFGIRIFFLCAFAGAFLNGSETLS